MLDNYWDASNIFSLLSKHKKQEIESDLNVYNFDAQNKVIIGYKPDGSAFFGCPQIGTIEGFLTPRAKLEVFQSIDLQNRGTIEPAIVLSFQSFSEDELKSMSRRLETTLEIIMEHFRETEDRMEDLETQLEELKDALRKTS